jgi:hypothetical protein
MPKAVMNNGRIVIVKTDSEIEGEYKDRLDVAARKYLETLVIHEDSDPDKVRAAKDEYKKLIQEKNGEIVRNWRILTGE